MKKHTQRLEGGGGRSGTNNIRDLPARLVFELDKAVNWERFVGEEVAESWSDVVRFRRHHDALPPEAVGRCHLKVVAEHAGAVWDARDVVGSGHVVNFERFGQTSTPRRKRKLRGKERGGVITEKKKQDPSRNTH